MKTKLRILAYPFLVMGCLTILLTGCQKKPPPAVEPTLNTSEMIGITSNWAISGGNITDDGGGEIVDRGVCWSTANPPSISDMSFPSGSGMGSYTCFFRGMKGNTTYYLSAYAFNKDTTGYGDVLSFTTPPTITDVDGNERVYHI